MPPLRHNSLSILFLLLSFFHCAFAIDKTQASSDYEAHLLTVQEYCQCLMSMAFIEDPHGLYDPETMRGEILRTISLEGEEPLFLYVIIHGVDPQSPMKGLTELDAMRCCNWMETSLPSNENIVASTEVGSYVLHNDGSFEVNENAQLHLIAHDDGTFEIISNIVKRKISPLMFNEKRKPGTPQAAPGLFPNNRSVLTDPLQSPSVSDMNITVQSFSNILHNDNFDDSSFIGRTNGRESGVKRSTGSYVAIKDNYRCVPNRIKDCFTSEETRQLIDRGRNEIRSELEHAMRQSEHYKIAALWAKPNENKISTDLQKFDQFFTEHSFTRGNLETFCHHHNITVVEPYTGRIQKEPNNESSSTSVYGSLATLGEQAATGIQNSIKMCTGEDLINEETPNERTPLTRVTRPQIQQEEIVFNENHVEEIHNLILKVRLTFKPNTSLGDAYRMFDVAALSELSPAAQQLLKRIKDTTDPDQGAQKRNNWVYQSLDPTNRNIVPLKSAITYAEANFAQTRNLANQSANLDHNAKNFATMAQQLRKKTQNQP